jgi:excisionase family DNA binding protein
VSPLLLTYGGAAQVLACGRTKVYELVERGDLLAVGRGKGRRIVAESIRDFVRRLEEEERRARGRNNEGPRGNGGQKGDRN